MSVARSRSAVRREVDALKQDYKLSEVMTMEELVADSPEPRRFETRLFGLFAIVALIIATVGIYGVISYKTQPPTKPALHNTGLQSRLQTPDSRLQTPDSRLQTPDFLLEP
ncbi:MAG: hypothetical protein J2P41_15265 [Blastocatellia bacterium]|nr:hypothetical protein [Blastocatellia bacterium]